MTNTGIVCSNCGKRFWEGEEHICHLNNTINTNFDKELYIEVAKSAMHGMLANPEFTTAHGVANDAFDEADSFMEELEKRLKNKSLNTANKVYSIAQVKKDMEDRKKQLKMSEIADLVQKSTPFFD